MSTTMGIRDEKFVYDLQRYFYIKGELRNHVLINLGLYTALRISDLLQLRWHNVFDFNRNEFRRHIVLTEQKTGKKNQIVINGDLLDALIMYKNKVDKEIRGKYPESYIIRSQKGYNQPLSRSQAFRIIKQAADELNIPGIISCHSLRKTLGYWLWKAGVAPSLLMVMYNHSSFDTTKRYLCITQDEKDDAITSLSFGDTITPEKRRRKRKKVN